METLYPTGPNGLAVFALVTIALGGAASWATGRAVALTWRPLWQLVGYIALMTFAVRFIHYALFHQPFLYAGNVLIDYLVLMGMAFVGYRMMRASQMQHQYPWAYERTTPFSWQRKN
ncbi:MAG: hypothetical protein KJ622_07430 [Alphaproteobacteria bacterium]|nr:hypothetical protein [Alphaproteobacteria bacterium]